MAKDRKKSSSNKKIDLRSWKETWRAEDASFDDAKSLRTRLIEHYQDGGKHEREIARTLRRCSRKKRCESPHCPVCERRRRRKAQRSRPMQTVVHQWAPPMILTRASDIAPEMIEWLWPGRIALGKLSIIAGDPKIGKSQITAFLAATVSIGGEWPCHEGRAPLGNVIILSAEDDAGDTMRPRLEVANADLSRIHFLDINQVKDGENRRPFDILLDARTLEHAVRRFADVRLIIIDPITAFLKSTGAQRAAADRLKQLAANLGAAVVVTAHLAKTARRSAITQVLGSVGLVAVARTILLVTRERETDRRLFLMAETNIARSHTGLAFKIEPKTTPAGMQVSAVVWDGPVKVSADEALTAATGTRTLQPALVDARDFLRILLAEGPVAAKAIRAEASDAGISYPSLRRAAEFLGVKARRIGGIAGRGSWIWELPHGSASAPSKMLDQYRAP
jgi:putative DNA primase/helicase